MHNTLSMDTTSVSGEFCHGSGPRTLLFSRVFPSPAEPTFAPFILNTFRALGEYVETRVVSPRPWNPRQPCSALHRSDWHSFEGMTARYPRYFWLPRVQPSLHDSCLWASIKPVISRVHREFPFEAIVSAWAYPDAVVAQRIAEEFGCVHVTRVLGSDINVLSRNPRLKSQISAAMRKADCVVAVSAALKREIESLGVAQERIVVQHNAVDGDLFTIREKGAARARLCIPPDCPLICFIGNMIPVKGPDVLMEALAFVKKGGHPNVRAAFIGSGALAKSLRARALALGLGDAISWHERIPQTEVREWLAAADVVGVPSRNEGCPNVVLEAQASGRPVVASRVGGIPELLSPENGILVPSEDPAALAEGIECALSRTWSPEAIRSTVRHLSWNGIGREYARILQSAMCNHGAERGLPFHQAPTKVGV